MSNDAIQEPKLNILPKKGMFLDGKYVIDSSGSECDHIYAATGTVTTKVALAGPDGIDKVIESSRKALPEWQSSAERRQKVLQQFAGLLIENTELLKQLSTIENGMTAQSARTFGMQASSWFNYYAGFAGKIMGVVDEVNPSQHVSYHINEPYGVVLNIAPFNAPIAQVAMTTSGALAVGNCVIIKPSSSTPFTASIMAELFIKAGGPPGVFNVIPCKADIGELMCSHHGVNKIHFTGSVAGGKAVMAAAAKGLIPVGLELGGKSPAIVFNDADLESVNKLATHTITVLAGQGCAKQSRILVQSGVYNKVIEMIKSSADEIMIGDPLNDSTELGPVVSKAACNEIMGFIERAVQTKSMRLVHGGKRLGGALASGYFIAPTIFTDVDPSAEIFCKEVFGPVLTFTKFDTEEEAIHLANQSDYGLSSNVFTQDIKRAHRLSLAIQSGNVLLNGTTGRSTSCSRPFGGFKDSGIGRIGGIEGLREFVRTKTIVINL